MSIDFIQAIVAGTTLIREAIQSQNYQTAVAGWKIAADGTAEFSDLTIRSSNGTGATVVIQNGKAVFTAASGWKITVDPTESLPVIYWTDADGDVSGAVNATGDNSRSGLIVCSGPFTDGAVNDYRWLSFWGQNPGTNATYCLRTTDADPTVDKGGFYYLDATGASFGLSDSAVPATDTFLDVRNDIFTLDQGRVLLAATPSASPALWVDVNAAGQTGNLLHLQREGSGKFIVDKDGNSVAAGYVEAVGSLWADGTDVGRGIVAHASINGSTATSASTTELVAVTLPSTTYKANRAYELHIKMFVSSTVAADQVGVRVHKTNTSGTTYLDIESTGRVATANENYWVECHNVMNVGGSDVTAAMVLSYFRRSGTGNVRLVASSTNPTFIQVRDIGLASDYPGATTLA